MHGYFSKEVSNGKRQVTLLIASRPHPGITNALHSSISYMNLGKDESRYCSDVGPVFRQASPTPDTKCLLKVFLNAYKIISSRSLISIGRLEYWNQNVMVLFELVIIDPFYLFHDCLMNMLFGWVTFQFRKNTKLDMKQMKFVSMMRYYEEECAL